MSDTTRVDVHVLTTTPIDGVPVLIATGIDPDLEPETIRDIAEQLREQAGPEFRVVVVSGLTLEVPHSSMALSLLRTLEQAWTQDTSDAFSEQWAVVRQFLAAVDAGQAPDDVAP